MLGCELGSVIFVIGSNCEEERGSMHWWVTDQACCMSQQLKTTEHTFFFFLQSCPGSLELQLGGCFPLFSLLRHGGPSACVGTAIDFL